MRLIATGISGLIGTRLTQLNEYDVDVLDLTAGIDITNRWAVDELVKQSSAEVILHLAAYTDVSEANEQDGDKDGLCYQVNVVGTENVAQAAADHNKYLIHISTDFVFDGNKTGSYVEADKPNPIEWYGKTKYLSEVTVSEILEKDAYVILRLAYPYQADPKRPDFLHKMMLNISSNKLPPAFSDHWVTPTFADDISMVFDYCMRNRPLGIYHCVGSSWHSDYEMATMVNDVFGLDGKIEKGSLKEYMKTVRRPYQKSLKLSNNKLTSELDISMKTFREGLDEIRRFM